MPEFKDKDGNPIHVIDLRKAAEAYSAGGAQKPDAAAGSLMMDKDFARKIESQILAATRGITNEKDKDEEADIVKKFKEEWDQIRDMPDQVDKQLKTQLDMLDTINKIALNSEKNVPEELKYNQAEMMANSGSKVQATYTSKGNAYSDV